MSRLYVSGANITDDGSQQIQLQEVVEEITPDFPTPDELAELDLVKQELFQRGRRIYVRGIGLITPKQLSTLPRPDQTQTPTTSRTRHGGMRTRGGADPPPPSPDKNLGYYYCDIIPVRSVAVSSMTNSRETDAIPYSLQYQILLGRLGDPAQTGVLSSVVRGPNVRNATTMTL